MNQSTQKTVERLIDKLTPEQEARLLKLIENEDLFLFLAWLQSAKVVGTGVGVISLMVRKAIMALVWLLVPIVVIKWLISGEVTFQEIVKWFGK